MIKKIKRTLRAIGGSYVYEAYKRTYNKHFKYNGKVYHLNKGIYFPPHESANKKFRMGPAGELLAVGGDLSPARLLHAYKNGIVNISFKNDPLLWWTSEIRCVHYLKDIKVPKNLKSKLKKNIFSITADKCFKEVVLACAESRDVTWLTKNRIEAACKLHDMGNAHSIEVWKDETLVGGLYGVILGGCWQGESMFTRVSDSSKIALFTLALKLKELNFMMIDHGIWPTEHLKNMGAVIISRDQFLESLSQSMSMPDFKGNWSELFEN